MFDIGFSELLVIAVMGLIILGPERLPQAARTLGLMIGKIRRTMSGIQQEFEQEVRNQEIREKLQDPMHSYLSEEELKQREEAEALNNLANGDSSADSLREFGDHSQSPKDQSESNRLTESAPLQPSIKQPSEEPK